MNDSNDHAIALAALVFHQSLQAPGKVVFVTNDAGNKVSSPPTPSLCTPSLIYTRNVLRLLAWRATRCAPI